MNHQLYQLDPGSGRATRLRLILVHRKDVQHWTNYSIKTYQHPAWPGGNFQHELLWGYAVDGSAVPRYVVLPTVSGWELTRPGGNTQRGNYISEYDSLSLIHFHDAWRLQPVLTTLEDYVSELRPTSPLLSKLQRMLNRWQTLPPNERPVDQHPVKRPPLPPAGEPIPEEPQVALLENRSRKTDRLAGSPPCMGSCNIFHSGCNMTTTITGGTHSTL